MAKTTATQPGRKQAADSHAIREFQVDVPEAELSELRHRINATKWPERETVADQSEGVQLATIQELARLWATAYDWRKCEAKLNALPQFITEIDGLKRARGDRQFGKVHDFRRGPSSVRASLSVCGRSSSAAEAPA